MSKLTLKRFNGDIDSVVVGTRTVKITSIIKRIYNLLIAGVESFPAAFKSGLDRVQFSTGFDTHVTLAELFEAFDPEGYKAVVGE